MPVFEAESYVDAPFDDVWSFYSRIDGLVDLTPDWMGLRVDGIDRPEGAEGEILVEGSTVDVSLKPLGVLPRVSWRSVIVEREHDEDAGTAYFVDEMEDGPFKRWRHTHTFEARDGGTVIGDKVEYALPLWMLGRVGSPAFRVNAWWMFRGRHRKTRELLE